MISQLPLLKLELQVTVLNEIPLIKLPACLSIFEAMALQETCQNLLRNKPKRIVLDFSQIIFIDSSGIGALINTLKTVEEQGVELVLWSVHPQVRTALLLAKLDHLMIDSETNAMSLADTHQLKAQPPAHHPSVRSRIKRLIDILGALIGLGITAIFLFLLPLLLNLIVQVQFYLVKPVVVY